MAFNEYAYLLSLAERSVTTTTDVISKGVKGAVVTLYVEVIPSGTLGLMIYGYDRLSGQIYNFLDSSAISVSGTTSLTVYPGIAATNNVSKNSVLPYDWKVSVVHTPSNLIAKYSVGASLIE